jgi:hypothetical protein
MMAVMVVMMMMMMVTMMMMMIRAYDGRPRVRRPSNPRPRPRHGADGRRSCRVIHTRVEQVDPREIGLRFSSLVEEEVM